MLQPTRASLARRSAGREFYGWMMVLAAGLDIFASRPGQSQNSSASIGPISHDLGISITSIALAYALAILGAAFLLPHVGKQADRSGPRLSVLGITVLLLRMHPSVRRRRKSGVGFTFLCRRIGYYTPAPGLT